MSSQPTQTIAGGGASAGALAVAVAPDLATMNVPLNRGGQVDEFVANFVAGTNRGVGPALRVSAEAVQARLGAFNLPDEDKHNAPLLFMALEAAVQRARDEQLAVQQQQPRRGPVRRGKNRNKNDQDNDHDNDQQQPPPADAPAWMPAAGTAAHVIERFLHSRRAVTNAAGTTQYTMPAGAFAGLVAVLQDVALQMLDHSVSNQNGDWSVPLDAALRRRVLNAVPPIYATESDNARLLRIFSRHVPCVVAAQQPAAPSRLSFAHKLIGEYLCARAFFFAPSSSLLRVSTFFSIPQPGVLAAFSDLCAADVRRRELVTNGALYATFRDAGASDHARSNALALLAAGAPALNKFDLTGVAVAQCNLYGANLAQADLRNASITNSVLAGAIVKNCPVDRTTVLQGNAYSSPVVRMRPGLGASSRRLVWSPTGGHIVGQQNGLFVWDVETGERTLLGHPNDYANQHKNICFSPCGRLLVMPSYSLLRVYNVDSNRRDVMHTMYFSVSHETQMCHHPHESVVAVTESVVGGNSYAGRAQRVTVWDYRANASRQLFSNDEDGVSGIAFSPCGQRLAIGERTGTVSVIAFTKLPSRQAAAPAPLLRLDTREAGAAYGGRLSVAWSRDGSLLAGATERCIFVWCASTGERRFRLDVSPRSITHLAFSPAEDVLAYSTSHCEIFFISTADFRELHRFESAENTDFSYAFDGRHVVYGGVGGEPRVVATSRRSYEFERRRLEQQQENNGKILGLGSSHDHVIDRPRSPTSFSHNRFVAIDDSVQPSVDGYNRGDLLLLDPLEQTVTRCLFGDEERVRSGVRICVNTAQDRICVFRVVVRDGMPWRAAVFELVENNDDDPVLRRCWALQEQTRKTLKSVAFSPNDAFIMMLFWNIDAYNQACTELHIVDAATGTQLHNIFDADGPSKLVRHAFFNPADSLQIMTLSTDRHLTVWSLPPINNNNNDNNNKKKKKATTPAAPRMLRRLQLAADAAVTVCEGTASSISADGQQLALSQINNYYGRPSFVVINTTTGAAQRINVNEAACGNSITQLHFLHNSNNLVAVLLPRFIYVFDITRPYQPAMFTHNVTDRIHDCTLCFGRTSNCFVPCGKPIDYGGQRAKVLLQLCDLDQLMNGQQQQQQQQQQPRQLGPPPSALRIPLPDAVQDGAAATISFDADGALLLSAGEDARYRCDVAAVVEPEFVQRDAGGDEVQDQQQQQQQQHECALGRLRAKLNVDASNVRVWLDRGVAEELWELPKLNTNLLAVAPRAVPRDNFVDGFLNHAGNDELARSHFVNM